MALEWVSPEETNFWYDVRKILLSVPVNSINFYTFGIGEPGLALDADLLAIANLTGTNTIYYRSAADTWSPVIIGSGVGFAGGILTATGATGPAGTGVGADLSAIEALTGVNVIYYRSGEANWLPVTIGSGLNFNNGILIGSGIISLDADLNALAALTGTNTIYYRSAADTWSQITFGGNLTFSNGILSGATGTITNALTLSGVAPSVLGLSILSGTQVSVQTDLALVPGTNIQVWDGDLDSIAALTGVNTFYYRSGTNTWTPVTVAGSLSFLGGVLSANDTGTNALTLSGIAPSILGISLLSGTQNSARTDLGLVIGTDVQAYDADLAAIAALTGIGSIYYRSASNTWSPVSFSKDIGFVSGEIKSTGLHIYNTFPSITRASYLGISSDEFETWTNSLKYYYTSPIYIENGSVIRGNEGFASPLVASRAMCDAVGIGTYETFSNTALIRDRWWDLRLTGTNTFSFTGTAGTATGASGTVNITPNLDRNLPLGFVLSYSGISMVLVSGALSGASSLHASKIYTNIPGASGSIILAANGWFEQGGSAMPTVQDVCLVGDPATSINDQPTINESTRKYSCDGIAIKSQASYIDNVLVNNFPGHGIILSYPSNTSATYGKMSPWNFVKVDVGRAKVSNCLCGLTILSTDATIQNVEAVRIRDIGLHFKGFAASVDEAHCYGCGTGIYLQGNIYANMLQGENCNYGIKAVGSAAGLSLIDKMLAYTNNYDSIDLSHMYRSQINAIKIDHATVNGYALKIGSFMEWSTIHSINISCDTALGIQLGSHTTHPLTFFNIGKAILQGDGPVGVRTIGPLASCDLNFQFVGTSFNTGIYFDNSTLMTGNKIVLQGNSGNNIRWHDGTTGIFSAPNIPAIVTGANRNNITILYH